MAQFTEFPALPPGEYVVAVSTFIDLLREVPAEGEPFKAFRARLKKARMWNRERLQPLLAFLQVAHADPIVPSAFMRRVVEAEDPRVPMIARLQATNPLLLKCVIDRLLDRVHSINELLKYLHSFAYPGVRIPAPQVRAWVHLAQGLELFKPVGVRLGLTERGQALVDWASEEFDVDDFLEEDAEEPPPEPVATPVEAAAEAPAAPRPVVTVTPELPEPSGRPSPLGRGEVIPTDAFVRGFEATRSELRERIATWWAEVGGAEDAAEGPQAFGVDGPNWMEDPDRALYRLAVAAALKFRLGRPHRPAFDALNQGALDVLFDGAAPELPEVTDAKALMLASLVARGFAEHPDLANELERQKDGEAVLGLLERALGRALMEREIFWMLRQLRVAGVLRLPGLERFAVLPDRGVRDTLFRLGFLDTPYAVDEAALVLAAAAAARATGPSARPDRVLAAFAEAAGCRYGCPHRQGCDLPCRERLDQGL